MAQKKKNEGKVRKQECSSLKTALHKTYKKIYYRQGLTSQMCSRRRWLIMVVKSQSITMAEKRLRAIYDRKTLIFVQPTTTDSQSACVKKDNNGRRTEKICSGSSKET
jgi:hypothetical protein